MEFCTTPAFCTTPGHCDRFSGCVLFKPFTLIQGSIKVHALKVVFYKVFWIGTKSENPGEAPMPIPDELQAPPDGETDADQGLDFGRGLGMDDDEESGQGSKAAAAVGTPEPTPTRQLRARTRGNAVRRALTTSGDRLRLGMSPSSHF